MIKNADNLQFIARITGKNVLAVFNDCENEWYFFLLSQFTPANPSNHLHQNDFQGVDIAGILKSMTGFSANYDTSNETALLTKINDLQPHKYSFVGFNWIVFK